MTAIRTARWRSCACASARVELSQSFTLEHAGTQQLRTLHSAGDSSAARRERDGACALSLRVRLPARSAGIDQITRKDPVMHVQQMLSSHPDVQGNTNPDLIRCIEECLDCAQSCTVCADACLGEGMVLQLRQCIRFNLDCADLCDASARIASRRTGANESVIVATLRACEEACALCAEECERHAHHHEHCRICAESCRRCQEACNSAAASIGARH